MIKKITDKDRIDWENFLSNKEKIPNKDLNLNKQNITNTKSYDFHGYSLDEANKEIKKIIKRSYFNKVRKLKIITGKGIHSQNIKDPYVSKDLGILKYSIPEYIKNNNELMKLIIKVEEANFKDGGSGAFYIYLKKNK